MVASMKRCYNCGAMNNQNETICYYCGIHFKFLFPLNRNVLQCPKCGNVTDYLIKDDFDEIRTCMDCYFGK